MNIKHYTDYIDNTKKWRLDQLDDPDDPWDIDAPWTTQLLRYGYDPILLDKNFDLLKLYKDEKMTYNNSEEKEKEKETNRIEALRYEDGSIVNIVPEHHVMFGKTYFYGKIVSMFGRVKGGKGMKGMMKYMMMSEMMKGSNNNNSSMNSMLPMMMLMNGGGMEDMFGDMFDFEEEDEKEEK